MLHNTQGAIMPLKLITSIINGEKSIYELSPHEADTLIENAVANGDFTAFQYVTNRFSGLYNYEDKPYWLLSNFDAPYWEIQLNHKKTIDWDSVILDDGEKLTNEKHQPLLNTFKHWIIATDNPFANGGQLLKPTTVAKIIDNVISWINAILLHAQTIHLSKQHLSGLNDDFLMTILINVAERKKENGIYDFHTRLKALLLDNIQTISNDEANNFAANYPFIYRDILPEDTQLNLNIADRIKACYWLKKQGFYQQNLKDNYLQGNISVLITLLYQSKILCANTLGFNALEELKLNKPQVSREYFPVIIEEQSKNSGKGLLRKIISSLKYLAVTQTKNDCSPLPYGELKNITLKRVSKHVALKPCGRTQTLPFNLLFSLFNDCFTFVHTHQKAILDSVLSVLTEAKNIDRKGRVGIKKSARWRTITPLQQWRTSEDAVSLLTPSLREMGVNSLQIDKQRDDKFTALRDNEGLLELFQVLTGSIQVLVGMMMAKRQDELTSLSATGNLSPNINPSSDEGKTLDYSLLSAVKKTGSGGENATNDQNKRPIPRSVALFVWHLEQFNQEIIDRGINKASPLTLFTHVSANNFDIHKTYEQLFNAAFDSACDYHETLLVKDNQGHQRRHYVRQHPLRRFFAMCFFYSDGYDGLETLRWMLGHSDVEHLYHYISESDTGGALKNTKATYLADAIEGKVTLEGIDSLREKIVERYGLLNGSQIDIEPLSTAIELYDDDDFSTTPTIGELRTSEELETKILSLINDDIVTLEPEFFTVSDEKRFNLILKVKEED